jgi:hypothetical protein
MARLPVPAGQRLHAGASVPAWLALSGSSGVATVGETTAPSRMEQSVEGIGAVLQLVHLKTDAELRSAFAHLWGGAISGPQARTPPRLLRNGGDRRIVRCDRWRAEAERASGAPWRSHILETRAPGHIDPEDLAWTKAQPGLLSGEVAQHKGEYLLSSRRES